MLRERPQMRNLSSGMGTHFLLRNLPDTLSWLMAACSCCYDTQALITWWLLCHHLPLASGKARENAEQVCLL